MENKSNVMELIWKDASGADVEKTAALVCNRIENVGEETWFCVAEVVA